jgi:hypothetical protein
MKRNKVKLSKSKVVPQHTKQAQGERSYSSYSFMTSALDGGEWSASLPVNLVKLD